MAKAAVIIPCYNQGQYLDQAVDSIVRQTFQDFEILIVNDGSTDPLTVEKLKHYNRPKTRVLHTSNQGLPNARNNGIRETDSEYILPLDADDYMGETFLEKAVPVLNTQPRVGIVACGLQYFGISDKRIIPKIEGVQTFLGQNHIGVSSLFRRICWEQVGGYTEKIRQGYQDWNFWIDILKRGWQIHVIPEHLYFYRRRRDSMVTKSNLKRPELVKMIVENHKELYQQYVAEVVYEKEKKILELKLDRKKIQNSLSYRIGEWIASPYRQIRRLVKGK